MLCDKVAEGYAGDFDLWEQDSANEYQVNKVKEDAGEKTFFTGSMQCYCEEEAEKTSKKEASRKLFDVDVRYVDENGVTKSKTE